MTPKEKCACASCTTTKRKADHASWSRKCPCFLKTQQRMRDRFPENHMRYYPGIGEDWTWVLKVDSMTDKRHAEREWRNDDERRHSRIQEERRRDNRWKQWPIVEPQVEKDRGWEGWGLGEERREEEEPREREEGEANKRQQGLPMTQKTTGTTEKERGQNGEGTSRTKTESRSGQSTLERTINSRNKNQDSSRERQRADKTPSLR